MEKPIGILPVGFWGSVINVGIEIKEEAYGYDFLNMVGQWVLDTHPKGNACHPRHSGA